MQQITYKCNGVIYFHPIENIYDPCADCLPEPELSCSCCTLAHVIRALYDVEHNTTGNGDPEAIQIVDGEMTFPDDAMSPCMYCAKDYSECENCTLYYVGNIILQQRRNTNLDSRID